MLLVEAPRGIDFEKWQAALEAHGVQLRHVFPPAGALVLVEAGQGAAFLESRVPPGSRVYSGNPTGADAERLQALHEGRILLRAQLALLARDQLDQPAPPQPLLGDGLVVPTSGIRMESQGTCSSYSQYRTTSAYLLGRSSVNIILAESTGAAEPNLENWTSNQEEAVYNKIIQGLNQLSAFYNLTSTLRPTWTYHFYFGRTDARARTGYEPIRHPSEEQSLWIREIYDQLGYSADIGPDENGIFEQGFHFAGDTRSNDRTNWAFTIFVVNSYNDTDGRFADGRIAYAYLGGPFVVMSYDNDGWGIGGMNYATRHEVGHIFNALDEYPTSPCQCLDESGYVGYLNQNCERGCLSDTPCIMNTDSDNSVCPFSRGMIGWGDRDADGIPDPVDVGPETELSPFNSDPYGGSSLTFLGSATIPALPNENLYGYTCDINIVPVKKVDYRLDGGSWRAATASDGAFDSGEEGFRFAPTLGAGNHTIEARAGDSLGRLDATPAAVCSSRWYVDEDGDGFGAPGTAVLACAQPAGLVAVPTDCDDGDPLRFPGNPEVCDARDNDCDGVGEGDADFDALLDCQDDCLEIWNSDQLDSDGDGIGDVCEEDALFAAANLSVAGFSLNRIDGRDLAVFAAALGACPGDPNFQPSANLDRVPEFLGAPGACVGLPDFHIFMSHFGSTP